MEKLLVQQGLNELKLLDSRINKAISSTPFVMAAKKSDKNITPGVTKEDFIRNAKAGYDQTTALIRRRNQIKEAIIKSNAVTEVEVAGDKMTVAKAIDLKQNLSYHKTFLVVMKKQFEIATSDANKRNMAVESKIDNMILAAVGRDSKDKIDKGMYDAIAGPIKENEEYALVDPLNIQEVIKNLEKKIEDFESEVDAKLQVSNCITTIEIED